MNITGAKAKALVVGQIISVALVLVAFPIYMLMYSVAGLVVGGFKGACRAMEVMDEIWWGKD